eukprot:TRINITY_DN7967_c0_g5_i2.p1 TRINITY_DN7967_c0_g5~~TRINITY_DN7967_c0_g5_i2.p1  ORF type:complete len:780 (+),score=221.91 TRINITY_DN7967_c0_g5_i2:60-2399(+)
MNIQTNSTKPSPSSAKNALQSLFANTTDSFNSKLNTSFPSALKHFAETSQERLFLAKETFAQSQASELGDALLELSLDAQKLPVPVPFTLLPVAESPPVLKCKKGHGTAKKSEGAEIYCKGMLKNSSSGLLQTLIKQFNEPREKIAQRQVKSFNTRNDEGKKSISKEVVDMEIEEQDQTGSKSEQSKATPQEHSYESEHNLANKDLSYSNDEQSIQYEKSIKRVIEDSLENITRKANSDTATECPGAIPHKDSASENAVSQSLTDILHCHREMVSDNEPEEVKELNREFDEGKSVDNNDEEMLEEMNTERQRDAENEIDAILNCMQHNSNQYREDYSTQGNKIENYLNWSSGTSNKVVSSKMEQESEVNHRKSKLEIDVASAGDNDTSSKANSSPAASELLYEDKTNEPGNDNSMMQEKLSELDSEIGILKQEQDVLRKQKEEYNALFEMLREEMEMFYKQRDHDIQEFEKEKEEHTKNMLKERQELEQQAKVLSKKEKEEIANLKRQVNKLKDELKAKDESRKTLFTKMKKEMEEVIKRNNELQKKVKQLTSQNRSQSPIQRQYRMKTPDAKSLRSEKELLLQVTSIRRSIKKEQLVKRVEKSPLKSCNSVLVNINCEHTGKGTKSGKSKGRNNESMSSKMKSVDFGSKSDSLNSLCKKEAQTEDAVYDMKFLDKYHTKGAKLLSASTQDGKATRIFSNGKVEVTFTNGVKKESFPDGYTVVYFNNKDIKQTYPNGRVVYYFAEARTTQTTFGNGVQAFKFPNNQLEKHYPDGRKEIV